MEYTEASIQQILGRHYGIKRGYVTMPNVLLYVNGMYEADFIYITKSNYLFEVEIKISIFDFRADFDKKCYHNSPKVRALYYAFPEDLWDNHRKDILELTKNVGAGIILCDKEGCKVWDKPKLRKVKPLTTDELLRIMRIGCLKWIRK